ncbi:hypothetical protein DPMN_093747 [Dreissena polymorpha]|uniref:Uncharacterized protein n=1 Tax=Dreissena polymorpha TaxID=45954 RepID=A0A9D4R274_DREPO|nr:hypothetical protein DPMN_093747 [Dreissena polymorpha]
MESKANASPATIFPLVTQTFKDSNEPGYMYQNVCEALYQKGTIMDIHVDYQTVNTLKRQGSRFRVALSKNGALQCFLLTQEGLEGRKSLT